MSVLGDNYTKKREEIVDCHAGYLISDFFYLLKMNKN